MSIIDNMQTQLSNFQAIPVIGPLIFSPFKIALSTLQIISGIAVAIICGVGAVSMALIQADSLAGRLAQVSINGFIGTINGLGSLLYASANLATLGVLGFSIKLYETCNGFDINKFIK